MTDPSSQPAKALPCPFCGNPPDVYELSDGVWSIECGTESCRIFCETIGELDKESAFAAWNRRSAASEPTSKGVALDAEGLARLFHDTYERLAPSFGYQTRQDTRDFDRGSSNGKLMVAVAGEILAALASSSPEGELQAENAQSFSDNEIDNLVGYLETIKAEAEEMPQVGGNEATIIEQADAALAILEGERP